MTAAQKFQFVREEDYLADELQSETKHEFVGGVIYAMAGAKIRHNRIAGNAFAALHSALRGSPCDAFNSDTKVRIKMRDHNRFYYPDTMVVCDSNADDESYQDQPVMIFEVASESTRRIDEGEKKEAYLTIPTLACYILVDQNSPSAAAWHRRPISGFERVVYEGEDAVIPLPEIDVDLCLGDLFAGVELEA